MPALDDCFRNPTVVDWSLAWWVPTQSDKSCTALQNGDERGAMSSLSLQTPKGRGKGGRVKSVGFPDFTLKNEFLSG